MRKAAISTVFLLAMAAGPTVPAAEPPAQERPKRYVEGQLLTLIPPAYPEASLKRGETGTVEVSGKIQPDGSLASFTLWSEPPSVQLEEAVRKVVPDWRFQPRVESPSCQFRETPGRATIWFEIENARPKVSYSRLKARPQPFAAAPLFEDRTPSRAFEPRPPESAARNAAIPDEVLQIAYVGILADGTVHSVSVAPLPFHRDYAPNLRTTLMQWRFEPAPRPGCMEIEVRFSRE